MTTMINKHGEATSLTKAAALAKAGHNARYRHGQWFAWQHKSGEWYVGKIGHLATLEDAVLNVVANSKVYLIGGGGPLSMVFSRMNSGVLRIWEKNARLGY